MALSKFKYVGGRDTGINPEKSKTLFGIVFPLGKEVEVPDDVAHKLRTKAGRDGDEFVEVKAEADKTEAELQREAEIKDEKKAAKKSAKETPTPEEIEDLKAKAAREDARVQQVQEAAKAGR